MNNQTEITSCSIEDYKKEKKFLQEIENYIKLIFDILNKNIKSTIEQRNDIYKYIKTTNFEDNSFFLNIKEDILKIINNDAILLKEYNNFNNNQSGGIDFKKITNSAFLGFAALANAITYHANPSDYASSASQLNPSTSLVSIGNSIGYGSCGFASAAIIHGDKLKLTSLKPVLKNLKSKTTNNLFVPNLGVTESRYNEILKMSDLPDSNMVSVVNRQPVNQAISDLTTTLSFISSSLQSDKTTGEYRTMLAAWNIVDDKKIYGHARVLIIDVNGNLAVYDPNIGFIYSQEYGEANPETIKNYIKIRDKPNSPLTTLKSWLPKWIVGTDSNTQFGIIETSSIAEWLVNNQHEFISTPRNSDKFLFDIDMNISPEGSVTKKSLNNMEQFVASIAKHQYDTEYPGSKIKPNEAKWMNEQLKKGGNPEILDNQPNSIINLIINNIESCKKNPFPLNTNKYEAYQTLNLYSAIKPEISNEIENIKKSLEKKGSFNPVAIKKSPKLTYSEIKKQKQDEEAKILQQRYDKIPKPYDFVLDKRSRKQKREEKRKAEKLTKRGGKTRKNKTKKNKIKKNKIKKNKKIN